jgi:hypothetical protein
VNAPGKKEMTMFFLIVAQSNEPPSVIAQPKARGLVAYLQFGVADLARSNRPKQRRPDVPSHQPNDEHDGKENVHSRLVHVFLPLN